MRKKRVKNFETVLSYMTPEISEAVRRRLSELNASIEAVAEIRIRKNGECALVINGENRSLGIRVDNDAMREIFKRVSGGALFAHRDELCRGFISLPSGIRVGVCGLARYEGGRVVGVTDISSLVFRIPTCECFFAKQLYGDWLLSGGGMLICSPAGEGKTTAIRAIARLIGSGEHPRRVVAVDERCEFDPSEYEGTHVDILRGYQRSLGVDIAIRTMSCEVLIVDEISSLEDSRAMLASLGAGVDVIATTHARSLEDAMKRSYIRELVWGGLFENACILNRRGLEYTYRIEKIRCFTEAQAALEGR